MPTNAKAPRLARPDPRARPRTLDAPNMPKSLCLNAQASIEIEATAGDGTAPKLPRFRMVAYTGGPMRIAGWRWRSRQSTPRASGWRSALPRCSASAAVMSRARVLAPR